MSSYSKSSSKQTARETYKIEKLVGRENSLKNEAGIKNYKFRYQVSFEEFDEEIKQFDTDRKRIFKAPFLTNVNGFKEGSRVTSLENFDRENTKKDLKRPKIQKEKIELIRDLHSKVREKRESIKLARQKEIKRLVKEFLVGRYKERFKVTFEEVVKYMMGVDRLRENMKFYHAEIKVKT